jgi:hypothetical protein
MKSIVLALTTVATLLAGMGSAFAAPAYVVANADVYNGPGSQYGSTGQIITRGMNIDAYCDGSGWCEMKAYNGRLTGWVQQSAVGFNAQPQPQPQPVPNPQPWPQPQPQPQPWPQPQPQPWPQPQPPRPQPVPPPVYEEAGACFYSERNFRGSSFCVDQGEEYTRLRAWNDRIRSVEVFGGARVDMCTDPNLFGSCVTLRSDTSRLPSGIDRRASSFEVY